MGNFQAKKMNNYGLTATLQSTFTLNNQIKNDKSSAHTHHLLPAQFLVPSRAMKNQRTLQDNEIKNNLFAKPSHLTLLTYNIWFEDHNSAIRYPCIFKMIEDSKADIVCLQEVNKNFLDILHQSAKYLKEYEYFIPLMNMHWYDTLILSKYPCRFYKKQFQTSGMGRCNLTAILQFADKSNSGTFKLGVNCVHLESLNNAAERMRQISQIKKLNENLDMCLIVGDFNFSDGWKEDQSIQQYTDLWKTGKKHFSKWANQQMKETGYTMSPTDRFPPWRPDHVIYSSRKQTQPQMNQIAIVGDFTLPPFQHENYTKVALDGCVRTPSDHFGLLAKIHLP